MEVKAHLKEFRNHEIQNLSFALDRARLDIVNTERRGSFNELAARLDGEKGLEARVVTLEEQDVERVGIEAEIEKLKQELRELQVMTSDQASKLTQSVAKLKELIRGW